MRPFLSCLALILTFTLASPVCADNAGLTAEQSAVVQVITDAYVDGIHNFRDPEAIRRGFHPDFEMLILRDGKLEKLAIGAWIDRIVAQNAKETPPSREAGVRSTVASFPLVEVVGTAATARVELSRGGKLVFTDFLSLYRFEDGWRIVGKTFYRHP